MLLILELGNSDFDIKLGLSAVFDTPKHNLLLSFLHVSIGFDCSGICFLKTISVVDLKSHD